VEEDMDEQGRPRAEPRRPRVETGKSCEAIWVRPKTGSLATEIPQFFQTLEDMFRSFEIPADLRAKLLLPFFSLKAKSLICRLNVKELEDYEGVRYFLLSELNSLPQNINRGLIMRPSVPMKDLFCCATQK